MLCCDTIATYKAVVLRQIFLLLVPGGSLAQPQVLGRALLGNPHTSAAPWDRASSISLMFAAPGAVASAAKLVFYLFSSTKE